MAAEPDPRFGTDRPGRARDETAVDREGDLSPPRGVSCLIVRRDGERHPAGDFEDAVRGEPELI